MPRRAIWATGAAITLIMAVVYATLPQLLVDVRNMVFDAYQRAAPRTVEAGLPVHVVDIDEAALQTFGQWPWPRTHLAELTDRLFDLGAVAVGFDILFSEPDRTSPEAIADNWFRFPRGTSAVAAPPEGLADLPRHDALFAEALRGRPVVLSVVGAAQGDVPPPVAGIAVTGQTPTAALTSYRGALAPLPELHEAAQGLGLISLAANPDGITRSVPMVARLGDSLVPSFAAELLRVAQGAGGHILRTTEASGEISGGTVRPVAMRTGAATYPLDGNGHIRIHFSGPRPDRITPVGAVLGPRDGHAAIQGAIAGKIVLVGASAQGLFDLRATPFAAQVPGVTLHAEILEQILAGHFLSRPDWMPGLELLLVVLAGLSVTALATRERPAWGVSGAAVIVSALVFAGWRTFETWGVLFDPSLPVLTVVGVLLPATALGLFGKERARRAIRDRFGHFLPEPLIAEIAADPETALTPKGAGREMTVLFVDMRRFSTITEKMPPEDVVRLLNIYLGAVSEALVASGATIDKYIGDAVMAFWNAPILTPDHPARALEAVFGIEEAVARGNETLFRLDLPEVEARIGVNTGPAFVGLMGSENRLSYTCVGDSVTQAARFEGLTRIYGVTNCVGGSTVAHLPEGIRAVELDQVVVKGRTEAAPIYSLYRDGEDGAAEFDSALAAARAAFLAQEWAEARRLFDDLARKGTRRFDGAVLAALYKDRIAAYEAAPPPPGWDGSAAAASKR